jgi:uncharacterized protein (TIGR02246 family)
MTRWLLAAGLCLGLYGPAQADQAQDIRDLYASFAAAQNAHDIDAIRGFLSESPDFLWITDGKPLWGRDEMITRLASFQKSEVWRVEPEYTTARVVVLDTNTAVYHIPLVLVVGSKADPARLKWLVEVLCHKEAAGWRIAGLFTAQDKRP